MKIGLVVEGGGMKCAYSAGILDAFLDHDITFDYCIGVSAGSANLASYLAGQRDRNLRFYTKHIHEPEYFGMQSYIKYGDLFNLNYIYGNLSNSDGDDPLDYEAMMENPAEFVVVSTDAESGQAHYFHKDEMAKDDYRVIMASCALPGACQPVMINEHAYYDGGVSDSIPVKKALEDGCDKVVVILSRARDFVKEPEKQKGAYTLLCRHYPNTIRALDERHLTYRAGQSLAYSLEKEGKAFIFAPSLHLEMGTYKMDEVANQALYDLGGFDYEEKKEELRAFLGV